MNRKKSSVVVVVGVGRSIASGPRAAAITRDRLSYPPVPVVPRDRVVLLRFRRPTVVRQPASHYDGGHADEQRQYYVQLGFACGTEIRPRVSDYTRAVSTRQTIRRDVMTITTQR